MFQIPCIFQNQYKMHNTNSICIFNSKSISQRKLVQEEAKNIRLCCTMQKSEQVCSSNQYMQAKTFPFTSFSSIIAFSEQMHNISFLCQFVLRREKRDRSMVLQVLVQAGRGYIQTAAASHKKRKHKIEYKQNCNSKSAEFTKDIVN